jgi:hypothetical protein
VISCEEDIEVTPLRDHPTCPPIIFSWPANTGDKEAMVRMENRRIAVDKVRDSREENA